MHKNNIFQSSKIKMKILLAFFVLISGNNLLSQNSVRLASDVWPPFTDVEDEKSLALDIVDSALSRSGIDVNYEIMGFEDVMNQIHLGEMDGSAALWYTSERSNFLLFSEPYLQNQLILVGKKGSDVGFYSFAEMDGKSIGAVANYAYTDPTDTGSKPTFVYAASDQENLEKLLSGQVDYILVDALLIQYLLKYQINDVSALLEIGSQPMLTKTLHFALRKNTPKADAIIDDFNKQIEEMKVDGTYNKILGLSWIRADVNGDGVYELVLDGNRAGTEPPAQVYDLLYTEKPVESERFFIDGQIYNSWSDVPNNYKEQIAQETHVDLEHIGYKISLNRKK